MPARPFGHRQSRNKLERLAVLLIGQFHIPPYVGRFPDRTPDRRVASLYLPGSPLLPFQEGGR